MLQLITGCMGSGKSAALIDQYELYRDTNLRIFCGSFSKSRTDVIASRDGRTVFCNPDRVIGDSAYEQKEYWQKFEKWAESYDVFIFDEIQFAFLTEMYLIQYLYRTKYVYVAGLDRDYTGQMYRNIPLLKRDATIHKDLYGVCAVTGGRAEYSELLAVTESGDKAHYRPVCREVFIKSKHCKL